MPSPSTPICTACVILRRKLCGQARISIFSRPGCAPLYIKVGYQRVDFFFVSGDPEGGMRTAARVKKPAGRLRPVDGTRSFRQSLDRRSRHGTESRLTAI